MKCSAVQPTINPTFTNEALKKQHKTFKGVPERIGYRTIKDWHDAVECWELLKNAKYLDVHSDGNSKMFKYIRDENYSFLDKLTSYVDKSEFIQRFCEHTKFPNIKRVSENIKSTFENCLQKISRNLNGYYSRPYTVLDSGFDPTCSVGLGKSFPGSDLDKAYIILEGKNGTEEEEKQVVNEFSGKLWFNLDQRIVSLNHPNTYPEIRTKKQVKEELRELDDVARKVLNKNIRQTVIKAFVKSFPLSLAYPGSGAGVAAWTLTHGMSKYDDLKNSTETNPYAAAAFNREVAKRLTSAKDRENAKNFAFFIETVEANLNKNSYNKTDTLFDDIKESTFVQNSNVTQIGAWQKNINGGYLKSKLRNRENLEYDFNRMSTDERYELIKDLVKYSSNDQSSRFSKYFKNDDDIDDRYQSLLEALK